MDGPSSTGRSARKRQEAVRELIVKMRFETRRAPDGRIEGPLRPCTLINFNPLEVVVQGQIRLTIPRPGTTRHHQVTMSWMNHRMQGHYCVIGSPLTGLSVDKEPVYYTTVVNWERDERMPVDMPVAEPRVFTPWSIGCEVMSQYNSASTKLMGGILLFDQDIHAITASHLEKAGGRIWVPERTQLPNSVQYSYTLREAALEDELNRIFENQQRYCDVIIQQAHALWTEDDPTSRKMITDTHRDWARYALEKGWIEQLPEWVSAKLALGQPGATSKLAVCRYCGEQQKRGEVYFCKQGHPFDVLAALRAGVVVGEMYVEALEGEDLEQALTIIGERKDRVKAAKVKAAKKPAAAEPKDGKK
jgi:hypothetical protein